MYFSIWRSTWKHIFFTVSLRNGFTSLCITLTLAVGHASTDALNFIFSIILALCEVWLMRARDRVSHLYDTYIIQHVTVCNCLSCYLYPPPPPHHHHPHHPSTPTPPAAAAATTTLLWGVYWFHSVRLSAHPAFRVRSVNPTVLGRFFPY